MGLDEKFKSILWEYDLSKLNLEDDIVVQRVLSLGDKNITDIWFGELGREKAKKIFLKNKKYIDKKSVNYWNIVLNVKKIDLESKTTMYDKLNTPIFTRSFG